MTASAAKDFGPLADDYAFFETHATEAAEDARAYVEELGALAGSARPVNLLDFGCGAGTFTARLLGRLGWSRQQLRLTLVEPVADWRRQAAERLSAFTEHAIDATAELPAGPPARFDVVLVNHVLYYVTELRRQLADLLAARAPGGALLTAIAPRDNMLIGIWTAAYALLGQRVPYHISEDVEAALVALCADYRKQSVPYELVFPDTEANRMRILRFLLADRLPEMPLAPLLEQFDPYRRGERIEIRTASDHYVVT